MSTKETLPMMSVFDEYLKETGRERLHYDMCSCAWCKSTKHQFSEWQTNKIISLRTRLDAAEKELEKTKERLSEVSKGTLMVENLRLKEANAELVKDRERLAKLANLIWDTRWVSTENDYQEMVGIAAEIRSGNFNGIDAAVTKGVV